VADRQAQEVKSERVIGDYLEGKAGRGERRRGEKGKKEKKNQEKKVSNIIGGNTLGRGQPREIEKKKKILKEDQGSREDAHSELRKQTQETPW